jgi:hypothetical protein
MNGRRATVRSAGAKLAVVLALALLAAPAAAQAAWEQPAGGEHPINRAANVAGSGPSIEAYDGTPYVAWVEGGQVQAARLDAAGTGWERPEDSPSPINVSPTSFAEDPTLRRDGPGESPCVAFDEAGAVGTQIHMSCLKTATDWAIVGDSPNKDPDGLAAEPSLTIFEGISWVAWSERDSGGVDQIRVAKLPPPGEHWQRVPDTAGPINADPGDKAFHPSLVVVGTRLYVAWNEVHEGVEQVHVARLKDGGDGWEQVGGVLNKEPVHDGFEPSMADVAGVPYVAFVEVDGRGVDQARVTRLDGAGTGWEPVVDTASPINRDFGTNAEHPILTAIGGAPYVTWSEKDERGVEQVRVARLKADGSAWEEVVDDSSINDNPRLPAVEPSLAAVGGFPYVSWSEEDEEGVDQVRVSRLAPEFLAGKATALTPTGATLEATVRTYGLPFAVGFEYGKALGEDETTPVAAPTGQEEPVLDQVVSGLSATTAYEARPFTTTGVPLPRMLGTAFDFETPAVEQEEEAPIDLEPIHGGGPPPAPPAPPAPPGPRPGPLPQSSPPQPEPPAQRPGTKIVAARISAAKGRATFRFRALGAGARRFRCALQVGSKRAKFRSCRSPRNYRHLKPGRYTFKVRALGSAGADRTPARRRFRIRG